MGELGVASKTVNKCTATVVATVKSGQLDLADTALDFTNLSLHEAKKLEMESQVRTLELEAELERERLRLAALRKKHYHVSR
uniref:I/LWEQ domain-containing protein n=1 Tax=Panagrolaimus superbus TaxID=310955 RepID=A0A914Z7G3_9BILA